MATVYGLIICFHWANPALANANGCRLMDGHPVIFSTQAECERMRSAIPDEVKPDRRITVRSWKKDVSSWEPVR